MKVKFLGLRYPTGRFAKDVINSNKNSEASTYVKNFQLWQQFSRPGNRREVTPNKKTRMTICILIHYSSESEEDNLRN